MITILTESYSRPWHSSDKYRKVIYRCSKKNGKGIKPCSTPHFTEDQLKESFLKALNSLIEAKAETIANLEELIDMTCQTESLVREQDGIEQELNIISERNDPIRENARVAQGQRAYAKKEKTLCRLYEEKHSRYEELDSAIHQKNDAKEIMAHQQPARPAGEQPEFREELWGGLVDYITVKSEKEITVVFGVTSRSIFKLYFPKRKTGVNYC